MEERYGERKFPYIKVQQEQDDKITFALFPYKLNYLACQATTTNLKGDLLLFLEQVRIDLCDTKRIHYGFFAQNHSEIMRF